MIGKALETLTHIILEYLKPQFLLLDLRTCEFGLGRQLSSRTCVDLGLH